MSKASVLRRLLVVEAIGFALLIAILWLNELADLPHGVFGFQETPINWRESLFETILVLALAALVFGLTRRLVNRIKYLEGFLLFCAGCKRVRHEGKWVSVDAYIRDHTEAKVTHGLCPDCLERLYGVKEHELQDW